MVSYEAIRQWCRTFGHADANQLRRRSIPTNRPASASGACKASSLQDRPNPFSPPIALWPNMSARDGIASLPRPTGKKCGNESRAGRK